MHVRDWLSSLETIGIKLGLSQISALLTTLGHPERSFHAVTVAGTNGKGSVTAMVERGLRAAGARTGRYTSPHLVHVEERIAIDGIALAPDRFDALAERVRAASRTLDAPPSYFEATTALALLAFHDAAVSVAVLEVGLGGRLDATNVVDADVAVVTSVALDHQEHLGSTLEAIAAEKAGIIKPGRTVVVGANSDEVMAVIRGQAESRAATVITAADGITVQAELDARGATLELTTPSRRYGALRVGLPGRHQVDNAVTAVRVLEACAALGWIDLGPAVMVRALGDVEWPARLEWRQLRGRDVLIDGAHNPAGAQALAAFLTEMVRERVPAVLGVMADKDAEGIVSALAPCAHAFVATAAPSARAMPADRLAAIITGTGSAGTVLAEPDPRRAVEIGLTLGGPVVVAGSLYLAGHVRQFLDP